MSEDENRLIAQRREKLNRIRESGSAFPNDFKRNALAAGLHAEYGELGGDELEKRSTCSPLTSNSLTVINQTVAQQL